MSDSLIIHIDKYLFDKIDNKIIIQHIIFLFREDNCDILNYSYFF